MGLTPQLTAPLLFCLLACTTASPAHRCDSALQEIIKTLNTLSGRKTPCTELTVADIFDFAGPQNTSEMENLCRAMTVLQQTYQNGSELTQCLTRRKEHDILHHLRRLYRALYSRVTLKHCPVNDSNKSTWKHFLENLKRLMKKKYLQCGSSTF
ncbi:interleukin-4 [Dipodomys spectabilis]|uniref:interleukin-4 n=1 Tax=Dipodomys spectabilis TaxID=105255 RepID=UPI001C536DF3|nr:interleukin-4 [Dipodomys spectabilis]